MNIIKETRERFGVTQEQFAEYLLQSRAYLSMSEINERNLPTKSLLKVVKLMHLEDELMKDTPDVDNGTIAEKWTNYREALKAHSKKLHRLKEKYERRLKKIRKDALYCDQLCHIISRLLNELPEGIEGTHDRLWLMMRQREITGRKASADISKQVFLKIKIDALAYEADLCMRMAEGSYC